MKISEKTCFFYFTISEWGWGGNDRDDESCAIFGGSPWCPESANEAKQVFANLAINWMKDRGRLGKKHGQPKKVKEAAGEFYT